MGNSLITGLVAEDELQNPEFSARPYPSSAFSAISYNSAPSLVQSYIGGGGGSRTSGSGSRNSIRRKTTIIRGSRPTTTTFRSFPIVNDYDNDSYDDVEEEIYTSTASTCSGIITFYTKTYHVERNLSLMKTQRSWETLTTKQFLQSLRDPAVGRYSEEKYLVISAKF